MKIFDTERFGKIHVYVDERGGWVLLRDVARALHARDSWSISRMVYEDCLSYAKVVRHDTKTGETVTLTNPSMRTISLSGLAVVLARSKADTAASFADFVEDVVKPYVGSTMHQQSDHDAESYELTIAPFATIENDKAHALKPLEEAAEAFGAWQEYIKCPDYIDMSHRVHLIAECCDTIQAACNLLAAVSCTQDELTVAIDEMNDRNIERGRFHH